ncbi:hypothetical protein ASC87_07775 [Rhizobacter sp. Root1221]|nr:hypothetical protein ASC87_07775 [Rhizobacter sp. Root1221]
MRPRAGFTMIHPSAPLSGHRPRHKVLVVDDHADAADSLVLLLEQLGCETSVAYTALEAVRQATTFLPALVLLDLHMPQISGLDAARAIRSCRLESKPVLVAVSADTRQHMLQASLDAGFDFHLSKPTPAGQIERMLRETLEHA